jgi:hypothetical protein
MSFVVHTVSCGSGCTPRNYAAPARETMWFRFQLEILCGSGFWVGKIVQLQFREGKIKQL